MSSNHFENIEVEMIKTGMGWQALTVGKMIGWCCDTKPLVFLTKMCPKRKIVVTTVTVGFPMDGVGGEKFFDSNTPHFFEEHEHPNVRTKRQLEEKHLQTIRFQRSPLLLRIDSFYGSKKRDHDIELLVHDILHKGELHFMVSHPWEVGTPRADLLLQQVIHLRKGGVHSCEPPFLLLSNAGMFVKMEKMPKEELARTYLENAAIFYSEEVPLGDLGWRSGYIRRLRKPSPDEYTALFSALVERERVRRKKLRELCN